MTHEELKVKLKELEDTYESQKNALYIQCAKDNNPYNIGDIVKDHIGKLKIEKIKVNVSFGVPSCVYTGIELKMDETPMKKQYNRRVHQSNICK